MGTERGEGFKANHMKGYGNIGNRNLGVAARDMGAGI